MSKPTAGTYYIINKVLSNDDDKLALTYGGQGAPAVVTPLNNSSSQQWKIADYDSKTQSVSPASASNLQAGWGSSGVIVIPAGNYVWTIRSGDDGYTIQDGGVTVFWGVDTSTPKANVTIGGGTGSEKQRWVLVKA